MKIYFGSGNYFITRVDNNFKIIGSEATKKCKCPGHQVGQTFPATSEGLDEAIQACLCMAAPSLKRQKKTDATNDNAKRVTDNKQMFLEMIDD